MAKVAFWEAKKQMPAVIVGSSLGALVALEVARISPPAALVLIAPAIGFGRPWMDRLPPGDTIPFFHHGENRELTIHRRFFESMAALDLESTPPPIPVSILMGEEDESVPFEGVARTWSAWEKSNALPPGSRFVAIAGGDHGLIPHVARIADEIVAMDLIRRTAPSTPTQV